jgi:hypothetical protein
LDHYAVLVELYVPECDASVQPIVAQTGCRIEELQTLRFSCLWHRVSSKLFSFAFALDIPRPHICASRRLLINRVVGGTSLRSALSSSVACCFGVWRSRAQRHHVHHF